MSAAAYPAAPPPMITIRSAAAVLLRRFAGRRCGAYHAGTIMHVLEISRVDGKLAETMKAMRGWLGNCHLGSLLFRLRAAWHRVEFVEESAAAVFAPAFSGCIVEDHAE